MKRLHVHVSVADLDQSIRFYSTLFAAPPTVTKTAAGASEWLEIERIPNTAAALERLKDDGFWVYGTDAEGEPPWEIDLTGKVVICLGGEEKGLRARTRWRSDLDRLMSSSLATPVYWLMAAFLLAGGWSWFPRPRGWR